MSSRPTSSRRTSCLRLAGATATLVLAAAAAEAQIAPGSQVVITGTADATDIGTAGVLLDFAKNASAAGAGNTGAFASLNRRDGKPTKVKLADVRVGTGPQVIRKFLEVGAYTFDLASLPSGPYGQDACYVYPEPGQRCTPYQSAVGNPLPTDALSPFYLENSASGNPDAPFNSVASFTLFGTVTGPGHATSSFVGTISTAFTGLSYQEALGGLEQYGLTGVAFTGTFVTGPAFSASVAVADSVVPEPSTFVLLTVGLAGAAGVARRRRRAAAK